MKRQNTLTSKMYRKEVTVSVKDNGIGIRKKYEGSTYF